MTGTQWALLALVGSLFVVASNALRARRTGDRGCLGHFFVAASELTRGEQALNRGGIALFAVGIVAGLVV